MVLDRKEYREKTENLLVQPAYRTLDRDPTNKLNPKLITTLRRINREVGMEEDMYKTVYPTSCNPQVLWVTQIS